MGLLQVAAGEYEIGISLGEATDYCDRLPGPIRAKLGLVGQGFLLPALQSGVPRRTVRIGALLVMDRLVSVAELSKLEDWRAASRWGPSSFASSCPSGTAIDVPWERAEAACRAAGGRLLSDDEWEVVALLHGSVFGVPEHDEWCSTWFDAASSVGGAVESIRPEKVGDPVGAPPGRHVIRGRILPCYHPAMRSHGAVDDRPYATTGFRIAWRL